MGDREKLVEELRWWAKNCDRANNGCLVNPLLEKAAEALENGVTAQEWIPVKDRLPELIPCNAGTAYSEAVVVWTDGKKAMIDVWDGIDFLCAADFWEAWGETITHWMPMPQPPKG